MRPTARRSAAVAALAAAVLVLGIVVARPHGAAFASCQQQLDRTQPPGAPRMAVVGASFTAGVGSSPGQSWAAQLARHLHWDAVIYGVPGAGYVRPGARHGGPVATELAHVRLGPLKIGRAHV